MKWGKSVFWPIAEKTPIEGNVKHTIRNGCSESPHRKVRPHFTFGARLATMKSMVKADSL